MVLITCVSNDMGIAFNNRRQSRDAVVCDDIKRTAADGILRIHPSSEILFSGSDNLFVSETYLENSGAEDCCFYEGKGEIHWEAVDGIVVYHWNRDYPSDCFFNMPKGFLLQSTSEFAGNSHAEIKKEVWTK